VTGRNCCLPDMNSIRYPPPTSTGHCQTACGIAGSEQITWASWRALPGSPTTMPGSCLGSGLVPPIWARDGIRITRTLVMPAGWANASPMTGAPPLWTGTLFPPDRGAVPPDRWALPLERSARGWPAPDWPVRLLPGPEAVPPARTWPQPASAAATITVKPAPIIAATGLFSVGFGIDLIPVGRVAGRYGSARLVAP